MKPLRLGLLAAAALSITITAFAGNEYQVKQRAKALRDNLNDSSGAPPAAPPSAPAAPAQPAPTPLSPAQASVLRIQTELGAITAKTEATEDQKKRLAAALLAAPQAGGKPAETAVTNLAGDIADVVAGRDFDATSRAKLASELHSLFNSPTLGADQIANLVSDAQSILQVAGVARRDAADIASQLKSIAGQIKKSAGL